MRFDFKITAWETVTIPEELQNAVLEKIKKGEINNSHEMYDFLDVSFNFSDMNLKLNPNYTEAITLHDNQGASTIEVVDESNDSVMWKNGN